MCQSAACHDLFVQHLGKFAACKGMKTSLVPRAGHGRRVGVCDGVDGYAGCRIQLAVPGSVISMLVGHCLVQIRQAFTRH